MTPEIYYVSSVVSRASLTEMVRFAHDHNDGNTLGHQLVLGQMLVRYDGIDLPEDELTQDDRYRRKFLRTNGDGDHLLWVAYEGSELVGMSGCIVDGTCYGSSFTIVHRDHRGRGVGGLLIGSKERWVRVNTEVRFLVFVTGNGTMERLARRRGYTKSGTMRGRRRMMKIYVKSIEEVE